MLSQKELKQNAMEAACSDIFMYELINILEQNTSIEQIKNDLQCLKPYLLETFEDLNNVLIKCNKAHDKLYSIYCLFIGNINFSFTQHIRLKDEEQGCWEICQ